MGRGTLNEPPDASMGKLIRPQRSRTTSAEALGTGYAERAQGGWPVRAGEATAERLRRDRTAGAGHLGVVGTSGS
jgi:hypothetical protein